MKYIIDWNCVKVLDENDEERCSSDGMYFIKYEDGEIEYISEQHEFDRLFRLLSAQRRRRGYFSRLQEINRKLGTDLNP